MEGSSQVERGRPDDCLPDSLRDALKQAATSTWAAITSGGASRCLVEVVLPDFWDPVSGAMFAEEGDAVRFWKLTRRFVDDLIEVAGTPQIKTLYPDIGVASMLRSMWQDAAFPIAAINDRSPVSEEDEVVVLAAPDPQGLKSAVTLAETCQNRPFILFNPRLASGDVGIGLNVRRMRESFLNTFTVSYSLRPIGDNGSVFRRWPAPWQVFVDDPESPGRFTLVAERPTRPAGDILTSILMEAEGENKPGEQRSAFKGLGSQLASLQRFMKALSQ